MTNEQGLTRGKITGVLSNLVSIEADGPIGQNEICHIEVAGVKLMAEVIRVTGNVAQAQVFESTRGIRKGDAVTFSGHMLEISLGPGLLSRKYDGLQNDLDKLQGLFLARGQIVDPLDAEAQYEFNPHLAAGAAVAAGAVPLLRLRDSDAKSRVVVLITDGDNNAGKLSPLDAGEGVVDAVNEMRVFESDALTAYRQLPLVVVLPETVEQVSAVLRFCNDNGVRVVPRGSGTSLSGGSLPLADAVLLVMSRFNRVLEIDYAN